MFTSEVAFTPSTKMHLGLPRKPFQGGLVVGLCKMFLCGHCQSLKGTLSETCSHWEWTSRSSCVGPACVCVIVAGKWVWWKPQDDSCNGCSRCFSLVKLLPRSKSRNFLPYHLLAPLVAHKWMETSNWVKKTKIKGESSSCLSNFMSC